MSQLERCIYAAQHTELSSFIPVHEIVFFFFPDLLPFLLSALPSSLLHALLGAVASPSFSLTLTLP